MNLSVFLRKTISAILSTTLMFGQLAPLAQAAAVPSNKIDISTNGFALSAGYTLVSGQPTGAGTFANGSMGAYLEGSCIPVSVNVKNKDNAAGDITMQLIYDYHKTGAATPEIGIDHLNAITLFAGTNPATTDNLNDFSFSGNDLTSTVSFPTASGTTVTATITGPFANDTGTTAISSTDDDRHYNVTLNNVPSKDTVYVLFCGQLGPDAGDFPGASMKISAGNGAGGNVSVNPGTLLLLPSITIQKIVSGGTAAPSDFDFSASPAINGDTSIDITTGESTVVYDNVTPGTYTVNELGLTGYQFLSGDGSTNCTIDDGEATMTVAAGNPATNAICVFTNETIPVTTLTVDVVVTNDNGGTLTSSAIQPMINAINVTDGVASTVNPGTYTVTTNPASVTGYTVTYSGTCDAMGSATLAEGDASTCTVTFDDVAASLTVIKTVINNTTGTSAADDFTLDITNNGSALTSVAGSVTGETISVNAGTYEVTESDSMGYLPTYSADCIGSIALGESKTCTITNTDEIVLPPDTGTVNVELVITNDNGGTLVGNGVLVSVTADTPNPASFPGNLAPEPVVMGVGDYAITSNAVTGYTLTYSADCNGAIAKDESKTCTITYDDQSATLEVQVNVVNDYNGVATVSDFTVNVTGQNPSPSTFVGAVMPVSVSLEPGNYGIDVADDSRYDETYSTACNGSMVGGDAKKCTVTLTAKPARLIVRKVLIIDNTNLEDAEDDFTLIVTADGQDPEKVAGDSSGTEMIIPRGDYEVIEDDNDGIVTRNYVTNYSNCEGEIDNGETITCIVTNNDRGQNGGGGGGGGSQNGVVNVTVTVVNDNGGTLLPTGTTYEVYNNAATTSFSGSMATVPHTLIDGAYSVTPQTQTGYTISVGTGCVGTSVQNAVMTCAVTYDDNGSNGGGGTGGSGGVPATGGSGTGGTPASGGVVLGDEDIVEPCAEAESEAKDLAGYIDRLTLAGTSLSSVIFKALTKTLLAKIMPSETELLTKVSISNFIENGSKSTKHLGEGERAGVINSFVSIYGHYPVTGCDWQNVIQMSREQIVKDKVTTRETTKQGLFQSVYKRTVTTSSEDQKALTYMTYGMRPMSRDLRAEDKTNQLFLKLYGHYPRTADEWDLMRAMTYGLSTN